MAKLAPFDFEIRYIPGPKNVVVDALSREPFVQPSLIHRLIKVPYGALVEEAEALNPDSVQDAFRQSCNPQVMPSPSNAVAVSLGPSVSNQAVSAVLEQSLDQEHVPPHAFLLPQLVQSIRPRKLSDIRPLPKETLIDSHRY